MSIRIRAVVLVVSCVMGMTSQLSLAKPMVSEQQRYEKMPLLLIYLSHPLLSTAMVSVLKSDLEFSDQFVVSVQERESMLSKNDMKALSKKGFPLIIVVQADDAGSFQWHMYTTSRAQSLKSKKCVPLSDHVRARAHTIAASLWKDLVGSKSIFLTKIAYSKKQLLPNGRNCSYIYIADYDGGNEQLLISTPTVNSAPRWNRDMTSPLLFYSEDTNTNMRLMVANLRQQRAVVSDYDGINMLPCFSYDGTKVVYCMSKGTGLCQLYSYENGRLEQLFDNAGNNISPSLSYDGSTVYFCSDSQTGRPQICSYSFATKKIEQLTNQENCTSPEYCPATNSIAYLRSVKGVSQIFVYDCATKTSRQITNDVANKEDPSWSPCGTFLLYSVVTNNRGRLAVLNMATGGTKYITGSTDNCMYCTWSPEYGRYAVI